MKQFTYYFVGLAFACSITLADSSPFFENARQLTFDGKRAGEGYFSADGTKLIFQSEREAGNPFYQIYLLDLETGETNRVSTGTGKTTCAWLHPDGKHAIFASTHEDPEATSDQKEEIRFRNSGKQRRYSWDYDKDYEIYLAPLPGEAGELRNLTNHVGYDAEGAISPDGTRIVFASNRSAFDGTMSEELTSKFAVDPAVAMEIYTMDIDGSNVRRLTDAPGYDGGPFFNGDGSKICWRRFSTDGATAEIWTMNADGSEQRQVTHLGVMSWAPFFHPSGEYLIFATNKHGFANFELYLVDAMGDREPVRVTESDGFDGLPVFSPDGGTLAWTSNRANDQSQIYFAEWNHENALAALASSPIRDDPSARWRANGKVDEETLHAHLSYLVSPELAGRMTGTDGERQATDYAAAVFEKLGLEPFGPEGSWFEPFEFTAGVDLGPGNELSLGEHSFELGKDWRPLSFSENLQLDPTEIVFAGYGIEFEETTDSAGKVVEGYSSYAHLPVKDKWVMLLRFLPEEITPERRQEFGRYSSLRYKAMIARQRGAKGLIVVTGPRTEVKSELIPLGYDASMSGSGIAAISVTNELAEKLLQLGGSTKSLDQLQQERDQGEVLSGLVLNDGAKLAVKIDIKQEKASGRNVLGRMRFGPETSSEPPLLIGAHIDHLGTGPHPSSRVKDASESDVHWGADDNASGVASLFEVADFLQGRFSEGKLKPVRDVIFACWSGEESGLLGSSHFVRMQAAARGDENAKLTDHFAACINLDMVGRFEKALILQGIGSSDGWKKLIEKNNVPVGLPLVLQNDTFLATDATSFYLRGIPILAAFTGAHNDYHTPADTIDKINFPGMSKITRLVSLIASDLISDREELAWEEQKNPNDRPRAGLRAYLGTIPDYGQSDIPGVKLSGATSGAPADLAGVKSGDVITKLAGKEIKNIYDYTFVLESLKIGEEVDLTIRRGDETLELKITPSSRQ